MNPLESFTAGLLTFCFLSLGFFVVDGAMHYKPPTPREGKWTPPDIAQCDRELWARIKDGCDES